MKSKKWVRILTLVFLTSLLVVGVFKLGFLGQKVDLETAAIAGKNTPQNLGQAPDILVTPLDSREPFKLSSLKGKGVIINFWATWCPPCKLEMPHLVAMSKKYSGKVVVVGISVDDEADEVKAFLKKQRIPYVVMMNTDEAIRYFGNVSAVPTTFAINKDGKLLQRIEGYKDEAFFDSLFEEVSR